MWCRRLALVGLGLAGLVAPGVPAIAATLYSLQPEFSVRETYDDNVFRVNENRRDDFITTVGAGVTLAAINPRLTTSASYRIGSEFFARGTEDQGQLTHSGSLSLAYQATRRLAFRLGDGVSLARATETDASLAVPDPPPTPGPGPVPTVPPPAVAPGSIPTRRVRQLGNTSTAGLDYQLDAFTSLSAGYSYRVALFDAPDLVDTQTHLVSVSATRQVGRNDRLGVSSSASWFHFDKPGGEDRQTYDARLTWGHTFSPDITANLGAGATITDRGVVEGGLVGDAALTKQFGFTRYSVNYSGSFTTSGGTGELLRSDRVALGVARQLSSSITGHLGAAYARSEPLEDSPGPTHAFSATAGLGATLTRWLGASLAYSFERADAPSGGNSFRDNRVTVGLTALFPPLTTHPL